ncbi:MAG: hypothetical protein EXR80_09450 [Methylococcales bacterium]|nr:hypothetical protein [Methylococcales bacterium]
MAASVHGAETTEGGLVKSPWAFDLTVYGWLPSVDGDFSAGRFDKAKDISFILSWKNSVISRWLLMGILMRITSGWDSI